MVTTVGDLCTEFTRRSISILEAVCEFFTANKTRMMLRCTLRHSDSHAHRATLACERAERDDQTCRPSGSLRIALRGLT
jgi:hypothetical protein